MHANKTCTNNDNNFDSPKCAPGSAYMALSRVSKAEDLYLLTAIKRAQVIPVTSENMM